MRVTLVVAARASDLARSQATVVGEALRKLDSAIDIKYIFKTSKGDQNPDEPLWQSQSKGVFTEDFYEDLLNGTADIVVHSWKDLPVEPREGTVVGATLPREDARDVLLVPKAKVQERPRLFRVLTSSPRRRMAAERFLLKCLPWSIEKLEFAPVRGNVATRIRKLLQGDGDGLFVAKAAIDRMLRPPNAEFEPAAKELRSMLNDCAFQVWPLSHSPSAAAQGALGIEVATRNERAMHYLKALNHSETYRNVEREREILKSFGGGCHQKLGMTCLVRDFGELTFLMGETEDGQSLHRIEAKTHGPWQRASRPHQIFPRIEERETLFDREVLPEAVTRSALKRQSRHWWVARGTAVPSYLHPSDVDLLWTAGVKTWLDLARRGFWVNGTADSLGEREEPAVDLLVGRPIDWVKLTHEQSKASDRPMVATYRLISKADPGIDFASKTHFFWMSGSQFDRALQLDSSLRNRGFHASGPGLTASHVRKHLGGPLPLKVFINYEQFIAASL